jgi:hypothetical protein
VLPSIASWKRIACGGDFFVLGAQILTPAVYK